MENGLHEISPDMVRQAIYRKLIINCDIHARLVHLFSNSGKHYIITSIGCVRRRQGTPIAEVAGAQICPVEKQIKPSEEPGGSCLYNTL